MTCKINGKTVKIIEELSPEEKTTVITYGKKQYTSITKNGEIVSAKVKINQDEYSYEVDRTGKKKTNWSSFFI